VGTDDIRLLAKLDDPEAAPRSLKQLPEEVEILHRIWEQQYVEIEGGVRALDPKEMPEAARRVESPYETDAHYSTRGAMSWVDYKVHLTESCDDEDLPNLITSVRITVATATDVNQLVSGELTVVLW
jgi:transposase